MRNLFIIFGLIFTTQAQGQTLKLNYVPSGQVIQFNFDSLTIYTDTSGVFSVVDKYDDLEYVTRVRSLIMRKIKGINSDTITFSGHFIPFNDSVSNKNKDWYLNSIIIQLVDSKKLVIIDEFNNEVTRIKKKKIKWKRDGYGMVEGTKISYINKETGEELFSRLLKGVISDPPF
jgi:hypothetical protein